MTFTTEDYSKLQKLMETSPENRELLQKLLDCQNYTLHKIGHEIRSPLALISSTLQLIEAQHPEIRSFRHWNAVQEDIEYLTSLLQELSDYNNGDCIHREQLSSYDLLGRICLSFASASEETGIFFTSRLSSTLPDISGDKIKLQEVFLNLLQNARDAVASDGQIRLEASSGSGGLQVKISDNGCGIPAAHIGEIFNAFVTHKTGGTGLGLAIARRVVQAHGGTISVDSEPGTGSCFTVNLPVV